MLHIARMEQVENNEIGKRIRYLRETVLGISQQKFVDKLGDVSRGALGNWELGKGIKRQNLVRIAHVFEISFDWLATGNGPLPGEASGLQPVSNPLGFVRVIGKVAANSWMSVDDMDFSYEDIEVVPTMSGYPPDWQFGLCVAGNCLNKIANDGDRLVCLDLIKARLEIEDGTLVIVQRSRFDGQMIERTAKRVRKTSTGFELWPESNDPAHQEPIRLDGVDDGEQITVIAKVIWILRTP